MKFGLITEGPTDQAMLENLLLGSFDQDLLDEDDITQLQPGGASDAGYTGGEEGGWERVLNYLASYKFREAFGFVSNIIVQIDTDVADLPKFDVDLRAINKDIPAIVDAVKQRLIEQIDSGQSGFYQKHQQRIFFAITVHSLETWLLKYHGSYPNPARGQKDINSSERKLAKALQRDKKLKRCTKQEKKQWKMVKDSASYDDVSEFFYHSKTAATAIAKIKMHDLSFAIFHDSLLAVSL